MSFQQKNKLFNTIKMLNDNCTAVVASYLLYCRLALLANVFQGDVVGEVTLTYLDLFFLPG